MELMKTIKVKNLNGTFEQDVPLGSDTAYISRQWYNPNTQNTEEITLEQNLVDIESNITRINGDSETIGSIDYKVADAVNKLIDGANDVYNTLGRIQKQIEDNVLGGIKQGTEEGLYNTLLKVNDKLNQLDGSGTGSIDERIAAAINNLKGNVSTALDTLQEIEELFNSIKSNDAEGLDSLTELAEAYNNLKALVGTLPTDYEGTTIVQYIQDLVNTEKNRAIVIETGLRTDVDTLTQNIQTEIERAKQEEETLKGLISTTKSELSTTISNNKTSAETLIATEEDRAIDAETALSNQITELNQKIENSSNAALEQKINDLHGIIAFWDGDTTDLEYESNGTNYWYKVSDTVLTEEDLIDKTVQYTYQESTFSINITSNNLNINGEYIEVKNGSRILILCTPAGIYFLNESTNACYVQKLYEKQYPSYNEFKNATTLSTYSTTSNESNGITMTLYSVGHVMQMHIKGTFDSTIEFTAYTFSPPAEGSMLVPSYYLVKRVALNDSLNATLQITPDGDISIHNFSESTLSQDIEINETFVLDNQLIFIIEEAPLI